MNDNVSLEEKNTKEEIIEQTEGGAERNATPFCRHEKDHCEGDLAEKSSKREWKPWMKFLMLGVTLIMTFLVGAFATWTSLDPEIRSLIKVKNKIDAEYFEEISDDKFYDVIFDAISNDLLDAYSWYMTEEEYADTKKAAQGNRSGFGMSFTTEDVATLRISRVGGNSPAENAGIVSGEKILGGGKTADTVTAFSTYDEFSSFVGTCATGEKVYLKLQGANGERLVEIARAAYVENYVYYRTKEKAYRFSGAQALDLVEGGLPLAALPSDTAYLRLTSFNGGAAKQVGKAMELFRTEGKKNLVLDLRGNGGGYMHILQTIAQYFCKTATDAKPLVSVADFNDHKQSFIADGNVYGKYFGSDSRVCVLADNNSASASECLLGAMLDYQTISYGDICLSERNGVAKTYGKGIMQTTFQLPFGRDAIKLTTARVLWPTSGNCIHGIGILPSDGAVTVSENANDDMEIAAAIQKLGL